MSAYLASYIHTSRLSLPSPLARAMAGAMQKENFGAQEWDRVGGTRAVRWQLGL